MGVGGRRLGILAGGGGLPRQIADSVAARGTPVMIVAIDGEADGDFGPHPVTVVNWGQIGAMIRALKSARVTDLVIVGRVHRPELKGLKPDLGFFRYLLQIVRIVASGGDDSVLRRVVRFFEKQGLAVIGPGEAAPELLVREGPLGTSSSSVADRDDTALGLKLIRALGAFDIGQSVVVSGGAIEAVEGVEGTDRMLARTAAARNGGGERRGVLVKRSKPGQDLRVDMPAIGPGTVDGVKLAGLSGVAVEADKVLIADRAAMLARADAAQIFIEGVTDVGGDPPARFNAQKIVMPFRCLGRASPETHGMHDAVKAVATLDALAPFGIGRCTVVVRNHVLAVEAAEGAAATLKRAAELRQWASLTHARRGVAGLASFDELSETVLEAVDRAGYAGIAVGAGDETASVRGLIERAGERGIFVIVREPKGQA